jgi:glycerophosphoryl diester phosphodiesterase
MSKPRSRSVLAFAHRGGAALWPENTVLAFQSSAELGVDALELDLRLTRDGQIVVLHDKAVDRTTNAKGPIDKLTLEEARALDAGYRHQAADGSFPFRGHGLRIPTLDEVVDACPGVQLNIELKPGEKGLVERALEVLDRRELADRVIQRFRALSHGRYRTAACRWEAWLFFLGFRCGWRRITPHYQALQIPDRHFGMQIVTPALVDWAHRLGVDVHVWTVNAPHQMKRLVSEGVDGLMTDRPDLLLNALR